MQVVACHCQQTAKCAGAGTCDENWPETRTQCQQLQVATGLGDHMKKKRLVGTIARNVIDAMAGLAVAKPGRLLAVKEMYSHWMRSRTESVFSEQHWTGVTWHGDPILDNNGH